MSALSDITTFARTGTATFVDSDGVLQTAATGVPRTAHHLWDGVAWVNAGLLLESEARTNLLLRSEEFDNASWVKSATTVTENSIASPDGTINADLITSSGASSFARISQSVSVASGSASFSIFFKPGTSDSVSLRIEGTGIGGGADTNTTYKFTSSTQDFSRVDGFDGATTNVDIFGDGWFRLSLSVNHSGITSVLAYPEFGASEGVSIYAYGAQLEAGSTPSSYIPTTGTTATRNAETLTIAAADAPWSGTAVSIQMEGTVTYADTDSPVEASFYERDAGSNVFLKSRLSGTLGTGALVFEQNTGSVYDNVVSDGSLYSPGINVPFNIASRHGSTFVNGAVDGTALTANLTPTALPDLSAADVQIGPDFIGTIKLFRVWADDIGDLGLEQATS